MQIDVWSDYACPWCALGLARLTVALSDFDHGDDVTVVHRSFELDRHAPVASPGTAEEAVARKYGMRPEQVRAGHTQLTAFGAEVGFTFDFERVRLGNTFDAHRLTQAARGTEWEQPLVRQLFAAHFGEGLQLSDHGVLRGVARSVGLPEDVTEEVLGGTASASRRGCRRGAECDGCSLFPHRWRVARPGRPGRRDAARPVGTSLVTGRPLSRGSRRPSPGSCWGGGRRSGLPSRLPTSSG
jgi:predicted DsbA family dithiol-disulfide isomerase